MTRQRLTGGLLALLSACAETAPDPSTLDPVARRYVVLAQQLGRHDPNYVDAYYGPDSLKVAAQQDSISLTRIKVVADSLLDVLSDTVPAYADSMVTLRHRYLRAQIASLQARARMVAGERFSFDDEAMALYGVSPQTRPDAHFDSLLTQLDGLLPGTAPLARRYEDFRKQLMIPAARVDTVFKTAIAACRERTMANMKLPAGERFELEYVKGTPWNAYNWYKGGYKSLIQVNLDFPIPIERALDLACHEGYPGHHVYNAKLEEVLVQGRGWVEFSIYPLYSPQSFIAEGSGNHGVDMAFPGAERVRFERSALFPLAGLDTSLAERNDRVRVIIESLNYARNEVARRYRDGRIDRAAAEALMQRYWLSSPEAAAKTLRFIDTYGAYVINYNLGRDVMRRWVEQSGGDSAAGRWRSFATLLSTPRSPADFQP